MAVHLAALLDGLAARAPAGFALGLHIRFTSPTYLFQTYPLAWQEYYSANGLVMRDPIVAWGMTQEGSTRWSALADEDLSGVLTAAADHGLCYGASVAVVDGGSRSVGGFARADREFTDGEIAALEGAVSTLHKLTVDVSALGEEDQKTIEDRSSTY